MTAYYFLPQDFEILNRQIMDINNRIREIGHEMGVSCQEGAETYHDNFAYEDGERQQFMWSRRLKEFLLLRKHAKVVALKDHLLSACVSMGSTVRILDLDSDEEKEFKIGSYMVFSDSAISYASPLARMLIGAEEGDIRSGIIAGRKRSFQVTGIS